jgi:papain like cysteine protease AvrRpt2
MRSRLGSPRMPRVTLAGWPALLLSVGCNAVGTTHPITTADECSAAIGGPIEQTPSSWPLASHRNVNREAPNLYDVHLVREKFDRITTEQKRSDFCWAACAEMVLRYHGGHAKQEEIVRKVKGPPDELADATGSPTDVMEALGGWGKQTFMTNGLLNAIVMDLASDMPVIAGLREDEETDYGHACVIVGVRVSWMGYGNQATACLHDVELFDPAPGAGYVHLSAEEFQEKIAYSIHANRVRFL